MPGRGGLETTGDLFQPYRLVDAAGSVVASVAAYFAELTACGRPATTQRSYGMDLLRWFRFLWALGVAWDQATGVEARDFCRWLQIADKPVRPHFSTSITRAAREEPHRCRILILVLAATIRCSRGSRVRLTDGLSHTKEISTSPGRPEAQFSPALCGPARGQGD